MIEEKNAIQLKYLEEANISSGRHDKRRQWDGRGEERERQREESLSQKDREKEIEAIKVVSLAPFTWDQILIRIALRVNAINPDSNHLLNVDRNPNSDPEYKWGFWL